jgi:hypothetical protein
MGCALDWADCMGNCKPPQGGKVQVAGTPSAEDKYQQCVWNCTQAYLSCKGLTTKRVQGIMRSAKSKAQRTAALAKVRELEDLPPAVARRLDRVLKRLKSKR